MGLILVQKFARRNFQKYIWVGGKQVGTGYMYEGGGSSCLIVNHAYLLLHIHQPLGTLST